MTGADVSRFAGVRDETLRDAQRDMVTFSSAVQVRHDGDAVASAPTFVDESDPACEDAAVAIRMGRPRFGTTWVLISEGSRGERRIDPPSRVRLATLDELPAVSLCRRPARIAPGQCSAR